MSRLTKTLFLSLHHHDTHPLGRHPWNGRMGCQTTDTKLWLCKCLLEVPLAPIIAMCHMTQYHWWQYERCSRQEGTWAQSGLGFAPRTLVASLGQVPFQVSDAHSCAKGSKGGYGRACSVPSSGEVNSVKGGGGECYNMPCCSTEWCRCQCPLMRPREPDALLGST